jgi:DNA helicase-2/ATP-dependent DNA helicase PcrA
MVAINETDLEWYDSKHDTDYEENYTVTSIEFNIGDAIVHTIFGSGVVVGIKGNFLDIAFKSPYGVKTLVKNHKSIKRLKH